MAWGQQQVYSQPNQAVAGDFVSANPRNIFAAGPGGFVAGSAGVFVGRAVWTAPPTDPNGTQQILNNFGAGNILGFVYNVLQGLNTVFLSDGSLLIPQGLPVGVLSAGDMWVVNSGTTEALPGQKAYANNGTGLLSFAATGSPTQGASVTASISQQTSSFTASINGDVMTVTAIGSGTLVPGTIITGTNVTTGTAISSQLTGTSGGTGTYLLNYGQQQQVVSETITGTYGLMTVTALGSGTLVLGGLLGGTGVAASSYITGLGTGAGGTGTYYVSPTQAMSSSTVTQNSNIETKFVAFSAAQVGGLVKITSDINITYQSAGSVLP
jgi:hypothetical protein